MSGCGHVFVFSIGARKYNAYEGIWWICIEECVWLGGYGGDGFGYVEGIICHGHGSLWFDGFSDFGVVGMGVDECMQSQLTRD